MKNNEYQKEDLISSLNHKNITSIITNLEYMKWLELFMTKYPSFRDDSWDFTPEEISNNDRKNLTSLEYLYRGIYRYALNNNLNPITYNDYEIMYRLKYNEKYYELAMQLTKQPNFSCSVKEVNEGEYINYFDILNNTNLNNSKILRRNKPTQI